MRFMSLGSGSKGNATLVQIGSEYVLVDCGFGIRFIESSLKNKNIDPYSIKAILVTHEHADHINGVASLSKKYGIGVYASRGTIRSGKLSRCNLLNAIVLDEFFTLALEQGEVIVEAVSVPHDANEPCQYIFEYNATSLGVLTDLGSISPNVHKRYARCNALLIEANHDVDMLMAGPYPPSLKSRVNSQWGHLNNQQAHSFVASLCHQTLQTLVIGHISEKNNHSMHVESLFEPLRDKFQTLAYANQTEGFDWIEA